MVVTLIAHGERVTSAQVDAREHAQSFQHIQGAVDGGPTNAVRAQLVDERFRSERAWLVRDGLHDQLAPARQTQPFLVEPAHHPLGAGQIGAALRGYGSVWTS